MKPFEIHTGDVRQVMRTFAADSFDACLSDPPYGLAFMGARWDYHLPSVHVWLELLRVLKPGAPVILFGGSRTFHRLAVAVEDAGFELRDLLMWLYGSGYPKCGTLDKAIDRLREDNREQLLTVTGWVRETARRLGVSNAQIDEHFGFVGMAGHWTSKASQPTVPTLEQWAKLVALLGAKVPKAIAALVVEINDDKGEPGDAWFERPVTGDAKEWPADAVNIRVTSRDGKLRNEAVSERSKPWSGHATALKPAYEPAVLAMKPMRGSFAENALAHGVAGLNVAASRIPTAGRPHIEKTGERWAGSNIDSQGSRSSGVTTQGRWPSNVLLDEGAAELLDAQSGNRPGGRPVPAVTKSKPIWGKAKRQAFEGYGDDGGASRFFYTTKADRAQRNAGCAADDLNDHNTVKPVDLARYMAKLLLPPARATPRRLLVPYSGSGSEIIGALQAGWEEVVGIERDPVHVRVSIARITNGGVFTTLAKK